MPGVGHHLRMLGSHEAVMGRVNQLGSTRFNSRDHGRDVRGMHHDFQTDPMSLIHDGLEYCLIFSLDPCLDDVHAGIRERPHLGARHFGSRESFRDPPCRM